MSKDAKDAGNKTLSRLFATISEHEKGFLIASQGVLRDMINPLLSQLELTSDTSTPFTLLDGACGTGVLTQQVQSTMPKHVLSESSILCFDNSEQMVGIVNKRIGAEGWINTKTAVLDAKNTQLPESSFSHVGLGLCLHLIPGTDAVLDECKRILKPGGIFGATTFHKDNKFWIPDMQWAFEALPFRAPFPETVEMQRHSDGDWTDTDWIETHLQEQGFKDVKVTLVNGSYHLKDVEEFFQSFGMMVTWLMNTYWDEDTRAAHPLGEVEGLMKKALEEKYGGGGWDIKYDIICMTGRVDKAQ
ncbi:S-adenosyl-L-methionine-dependent methyltransferase [Mariannaea sp. PMI_226]|nr:S-adenosyl-L-methionine-dependent methyltransferase [Mariannaea sp. PMI_226]